MWVADNGLEWDISVAHDPRIPAMHEEMRRAKVSAFKDVEPPKQAVTGGVRFPPRRPLPL